MTDELTALKAEIARLRAKYEPVQADPVEVLVASYAGFPSTEFVTPGQVNRMRAALKANGWRQVREVTEAAPSNKTHYCKHYPEGCQEHNLHCAWPACAVLREEA